MQPYNHELRKKQALEKARAEIEQLKIEAAAVREKKSVTAKDLLQYTQLNYAADGLVTGNLDVTGRNPFPDLPEPRCFLHSVFCNLTCRPQQNPK